MITKTSISDLMNNGPYGCEPVWPSWFYFVHKLPSAQHHMRKVCICRHKPENIPLSRLSNTNTDFPIWFPAQGKQLFKTSIMIVSWHQHVGSLQLAVYFQQDSMISRLQKKKTNKQKTAVVHQSGTKVIMWSEHNEIITYMYSCAWLLYKSSLNVPT